MSRTSTMLILTAAASLMTLHGVTAQTVAYWRFEEGPASTDVRHTTPDGIFDGTIQDWSGNGNHLSAWAQGGFAGYIYRDSVESATIPGTNAVNSLCVKNTGGAPSMFTDSLYASPTGVDIELMTPRAFTIEASFKCEAYNHRTIVGRDARNVAGSNGDLAALYFQVRPQNQFAFVFVDVAGIDHTVESPQDFIHGFDYPSDPDGLNAQWYHAVGVSDGTTMSLYINGALIGTTDLSGSPDPSLARGNEDGPDWHAGEWSVGRGLYAGGHTDRAYGYIDEVRISNIALTPDQFLYPAAAPCRADFNHDSLVNSQDFFDFLTAFFSSSPTADFNNDGNVNSQDFFDFLTVFFPGC